MREKLDTLVAQRETREDEGQFWIKTDAVFAQ